jgi:hypothetical protein
MTILKTMKTKLQVNAEDLNIEMSWSEAEASWIATVRVKHGGLTYEESIKLDSLESSFLEDFEGIEIILPTESI